MEGRRFDRLTRLLAITGSRRALLAADEEGVCQKCKMDDDCRDAMNDPRAACVVCADCKQISGTPFGCAIP